MAAQQQSLAVVDDRGLGMLAEAGANLGSRLQAMADSAVASSSSWAQQACCSAYQVALRRNLDQARVSHDQHPLLLLQQKGEQLKAVQATVAEAMRSFRCRRRLSSQLADPASRCEQALASPAPVVAPGPVLLKAGLSGHAAKPMAHRRHPLQQDGSGSQTQPQLRLHDDHRAQLQQLSRDQNAESLTSQASAGGGVDIGKDDGFHGGSSAADGANGGDIANAASAVAGTSIGAGARTAGGVGRKAGSSSSSGGGGGGGSGGSGGGGTASSKPAQHLFAGAVAAVVARTAVAPLERLKLEFMLCGTAGPVRTVLQRIVREEGMLGLWKGNGVNLLRIVPFKSLNFFLFDAFRDQLKHLRQQQHQRRLLLQQSGQEQQPERQFWQLPLPKRASTASAAAKSSAKSKAKSSSNEGDESGEIGNLERAIAGAAAGVVAAIVCFPLDTVRTRMIGRGGVLCTDLGSCLMDIVQTEGVLALYAGLIPAIVSMAPAGAVFYGTYDFLKTTHLQRASKRLLQQQPKPQVEQGSTVSSLCSAWQGDVSGGSSPSVRETGAGVLVAATGRMGLEATCPVPDRLLVGGDMSAAATAASAAAAGMTVTDCVGTYCWDEDGEDAPECVAVRTPTAATSPRPSPSAAALAMPMSAASKTKLAPVLAATAAEASASSSGSTPCKGAGEAEAAPTLPLLPALLYGAVAGAAAEVATFPFEVVRRQMQIQTARHRMGFFSTARQMMATGGVRALYAGVVPGTIQVLPSAALSYVTFEFMKRHFQID